MDAIGKYRLPIKGVLHVGAHECQEMESYSRLGLAKRDVLWVEGSQVFVDRVRARDPELLVMKGLVTDVDDAEIEFRVTNNEWSSSIYELGCHSQLHPDVVVKRVVCDRTVTLDTLLERNGHAGHAYNFMCVDIQGAELVAFRGFARGIAQVSFIFCEINRGGLYKGCCTVDEIDAHLDNLGFSRVDTFWTNESYGDALYIRRSEIANLHLGAALQKPGREPDLDAKSSGEFESKEALFSTRKPSRAAPETARAVRGVAFFVVVNTQKMLLEFAATYASRLPNLAFVFTGTQLHSAVIERRDTVVLCKVAAIVDTHEAAKSFAVWRLLATCDLVSASHFVLLGTDVLLSEPSAFVARLNALIVESTPSPPPAQMPLALLSEPITGSGGSSPEDGVDAISLAKAPVDFFLVLPLLPKLLQKLDLHAEALDLKVDTHTMSRHFCISKKHLSDFVDWYEPSIGIVNAADPENASRYHEVALNVFASLKKMKTAHVHGFVADPPAKMGSNTPSNVDPRFAPACNVQDLKYVVDFGAKTDAFLTRALDWNPQRIVVCAHDAACLREMSKTHADQKQVFFERANSPDPDAPLGREVCSRPEERKVEKLVSMSTSTSTSNALSELLAAHGVPNFLNISDPEIGMEALKTLDRGVPVVWFPWQEETVIDLVDTVINLNSLGSRSFALQDESVGLQCPHLNEFRTASEFVLELGRHLVPGRKSRRGAVWALQKESCIRILRLKTACYGGRQDNQPSVDVRDLLMRRLMCGATLAMTQDLHSPKELFGRDPAPGLLKQLRLEIVTADNDAISITLPEKDLRWTERLAIRFELK